MSTQGIKPARLFDQVKSTAEWALEPSFGAGQGFGDVLRTLPAALESDWPASRATADHLRLLLAAHYTTVATFVPTDVDAWIRHHHWQEQNDAEALLRSVDVVDEAARWPSKLVSARAVEIGSFGPLSGHDGEWLSVRSGALGRAISLDVPEAIDRLVTAIDEELAREAGSFEAALAANEPIALLSCATVVAHNLGDLSRVAIAWPKGEKHDPLRKRFGRLGHDDAALHRKPFLVAGAVNKAIMATENHRFLPLRAPRGLRRSRDLLLPIGPFFDAWGATIATHATLEERDRAEIVEAIFEVIDRGPGQQGPLRALAGLNRALRGGLDGMLSDLPARRRKLAPEVKDALKLDEERFLARVKNRLAQALAAG